MLFINNIMIKNLIISQGGNYIYTFVGTLYVLNEKNMLNNIKNYYGVSAGSILCVMLALKYKIDEIKTTLIKFDLNKVVIGLNISNFLLAGGLVDTKNFEKIVKSVIFFKTKNKNYTFKNLYDEYNINLNIFATCIEDHKLQVFNHSETPNIPIWKAVIASCCVPILFYPYKIKINNKKLHFIDGAISNIYPANFIPIDEYRNTIGICYSTCYSCKFNNFIIQYLINILLLLINNEKTNYNIYKDFTINIDIPSDIDFTPLEIINDDIKNKLYEHGIMCANNYFSNLKKNCKITRAHSI